MATTKTQNRDYLDAMIRHQIFLLRLSGRTRNEIYEILNRTEAQMAEEVRRESNHDLEKAAALFIILSAIRAEAWKEVSELWIQRYTEAALREPAFAKAALATLLPGNRIRTPSKSEIRALVRRITFEGKTLREWIVQAQRADLERIRAALVVGAAQRESPGAIARRIVGTSRARGTDGVTQQTRHGLATLTLTGIVALSDGARELFYKLNSEFFGAKDLWVSVLDHRTTPICRSLSGKIFRVGTGPHPPLHFRCRSIRQPLILGGGPMPKENYQQWLSRQPAKFQDEVLGPTRGKLFRQGGLTVDHFADRRGWDNIPLRELAQKERDAFIAAGLDPDAY